MHINGTKEKEGEKKHRKVHRTRAERLIDRVKKAIEFKEILTLMERVALDFIFFLLIYLAFFTESSAAQETEQLMTDTTALLFLKGSFTGAGDALNSWSPSSTASPCSWFGVICESGIVTGLRLAGLGLSGTINVTALAHFKGLRSISLNNNNFSGLLPPDLGSLGSLKSLFLSHNAFSGEIPDGLFASMRSLKKLWLNDNKFTGRIPSISDASVLIELRLEGNAFEGAIPSFEISSLKSFNVSNNRLSGSIPASLTRFSGTSFAGNQDLCGPPLNSTACGTPPPTSPQATDQERPDQKQNNSSSNIAALVGAVVAVLILIALIALFCRRRPRQREDQKLDTAGVAASAEAMESAEATNAIPITTTTVGGAIQKKDQKESGSTSSRKRAAVSARGPAGVTDLVMINEDRGVFGLTDLMKATAEVLGNGSLGSAYKATMSAIGLTVAVKRMRDMNRMSKESFDSEMRRLGTLRHPNVLTPLAYQYRKEEKLIVCEYVPKGSLRYILHGDTGAGHRALDYPTRLKIALGIARGMAYLHAELAALDVPHGNLKSANVLLGDDFEPLIADHGLASMVGAAQASQIMFGYRTPEGTQHRLVSPKSDVFCLGVVILELVTGKFPSQYMKSTKDGTDVVQWVASAIAEKRAAELVDPDVAVPGAVESMVRLLRVGAVCVKPNPEERPEMLEVAELIEEIVSAVVAGKEQS